VRPGASIFENSNVTARRPVGNPSFIANQATQAHSRRACTWTDRWFRALATGRGHPAKRIYHISFWIAYRFVA